MTKNKPTTKENKNNPKDETMELLTEINTKIDYVIKLIREEEYK